MSNWIALFLAVAGNVGANIAFKEFSQSAEFDRSWSSFAAALLEPSLWIGLFLGVALLVCYVYAIRGIPLSAAYTIATSVSIVGVAAAGVLLYGETLGPRAAIGVATVMFGVFLITSG